VDRVRAPYATAALAALTAGVYAWLGSRPDADFLRVVEAVGARPGASTPIAYVASPVVHASTGHLLLNLLLLLGFGPAVEKRVRWWGLLLVYVLAGAAGVAAHLAWVPPGLRMSPLVGASGAVSGVIGAHLVLQPWGKLSAGLAGLWAAANLAGLLLLDRGGTRGISYLCHLGGTAAGALIAALPLSSPRAARRPAR
jgi:membrane associated rhomboid family serine protease